MKQTILILEILFLLAGISINPTVAIINSNEITCFEELSKQENIANNCLDELNIQNDYTFNLLNNLEQQKIYPSSGNSTICGYITDTETGLPLENAKVEIESNNQWIFTYTNSTGYYSKIYPPTYSIRFRIHADGYLSKYFGGYFLYENDTLWANLSLYPHPIENSIAYGYVTDRNTNEPIENAEVELRWRDDKGFYYNYSYTDSLGFYSMNIAAGETRILAFHEEYFTEAWPHEFYDLSENETIWGNISAHPRPIENSVIYGYIYDSETGDPLENAIAEFHWNVGKYPSYTNITYTDSEGYYSIDAAAGKVRVEGLKDGYWDYNNSSPIWFLGENEMAWANITINPHPPDNCVVCGYITDVNTSEPIELARIQLNWEEYWGGRFWNETYTGIPGYYMMNVPEGEIYLWSQVHGYHTEITEHYNITENKTIWFNISMYKRPPTSSIVCGYITEEDSELPIENILVDLNWRDPYGHKMGDFDYTNASGFYYTNTAAGEIQLETSPYHYSEYNSGWITIGDNETLWNNFTLKLENNAPLSPWIVGPRYGKPMQNYNYTFSSYDSHDDDLYYYIEWGDGNITDWIGPYHYWEEVVLNHTWSKKGSYYLRAKAKDVYGAESDWSYIIVQIPRNKIINNVWFLRFLDHFPLLHRLLDIWRYILV